jgi:hypothetical protein
VSATDRGEAARKVRAVRTGVLGTRIQAPAGPGGELADLFVGRAWRKESDELFRALGQEGDRS